MSIFKRQERYAAEPWPEIRTPGVPPMSELISCGWSEKTIQRDTRDGGIEIDTIAYRLLRHRRHTAKVYVQWTSEHGPIEPLQTYTGEGDKVVPMGRVTTNALPPSRLPASDDRTVLVDDWTG